MKIHSKRYDQNYFSKATGPLNPHYQPARSEVTKGPSKANQEVGRPTYTIHSKKSTQGRCTLTRGLKFRGLNLHKFETIPSMTLVEIIAQKREELKEVGIVFHGFQQYTPWEIIFDDDSTPV